MKERVFEVFIGSDLPGMLEKEGRDPDCVPAYKDLLLRGASVLRDREARIEELEATVALQRQVIEALDKEVMRDGSDSRLGDDGGEAAGAVPAGERSLESGEHEQGEDPGDGAGVHRRP